MVHKIKLK